MLSNPKTPTERLLWAYQFGHGWNPSRPNLLNLDEAAVAKMDGSEPDAKELIASWQSLDANVNRLVNAFHGRELEPDGEVGPASVAVMDMRRCAMPDYTPPPNASFFYENGDLQKAVESQQRYAAAYSGGSGSWPKGCDPQAPNVHSVIARIDLANASAYQKNIIVETLKNVEATEAEIGQSVRHVIEAGFANPQHDVKYQFISGSVIGFSYFPDPDNCNQSVVCRIDNSFDVNAFVMGELLTHEYKGHSDGLNHTNGGIMNPSIGNPSKRVSWINDPSFGWKRKYFGGEPLPVTNPPPPPPPGPGGDKYWLKIGSNAVTMMKNDIDVGQYILVPK